MNRKCINSFAFFDLETKPDNQPDIEFNKTKITEICLVAASKDNILKTENCQLPRVLNKLSFCINPFKQISSESTRITGLDNFMLENENKFDENFVRLLNHYLLQLPQPVCLVAHNGDKFDYPIIQRQLKILDMTLPDDLRCMDSLLFFRSYEDCLQQEKLDEPKLLLDETNIGNECKEATHLDKRLLAAGGTPATPVTPTTPVTPATPVTPSNGAHLQEETVQPSTSNELISDIVQINDEFSAEALQQKQKLNESTPSNRKTFIRKELFSKRLSNCGSNSVTPPSKRELFSPANGHSVISPSKRMKFTLSAIHERLLSKEPSASHYAENDVLALLKCAVASKRDFIEYAEENAKLFKDIKPIGM